MRPFSLAAIVLAARAALVSVSFDSHRRKISAGIFPVPKRGPLDATHGGASGFDSVLSGRAGDLLLSLDNPSCAGRSQSVPLHSREHETPSACLLLATWSLAWIGLFSFSSTKLPHYIAPAFPALAVIAGKWIADWIAAVHAVNVRESTADSAQAGPATVRPGTPLMWEEGLGEQWLNWGWRLKAGIGLGDWLPCPWSRGISPPRAEWQAGLG